jgi:hypothetical protein
MVGDIRNSDDGQCQVCNYQCCDDDRFPGEGLHYVGCDGGGCCRVCAEDFAGSFCEDLGNYFGFKTDEPCPYLSGTPLDLKTFDIQALGQNCYPGGDFGTVSMRCDGLRSANIKVEKIPNGIDSKVIIKGGTGGGGRVYSLFPGTDYSGLFANKNDNGEIQDISNIQFCFACSDARLRNLGQPGMDGCGLGVSMGDPIYGKGQTGVVSRLGGDKTGLSASAVTGYVTKVNGPGEYEFSLYSYVGKDDDGSDVEEVEVGSATVYVGSCSEGLASSTVSWNVHSVAGCVMRDISVNKIHVGSTAPLSDDADEFDASCCDGPECYVVLESLLKYADCGECPPMEY